MTEPKRMGRPPIYATNEERKAARRESLKKCRQKYTSLQLDKDVAEYVHDMRKAIEEQTGVKTTNSETIRTLIRFAERVTKHYETTINNGDLT